MKDSSFRAARLKRKIFINQEKKIFHNIKEIFGRRKIWNKTEFRLVQIAQFFV